MSIQDVDALLSIIAMSIQGIIAWMTYLKGARPSSSSSSTQNQQSLVNIADYTAIPLSIVVSVFLLFSFVVLHYICGGYGVGYCRTEYLGKYLNEMLSGIFLFCIIPSCSFFVFKTININSWQDRVKLFWREVLHHLIFNFYAAFETFTNHKVEDFIILNIASLLIIKSTTLIALTVAKFNGKVSINRVDMFIGIFLTLLAIVLGSLFGFFLGN